MSNYQFDEGPRGPMLSWDYTSETNKCYTGKYFILPEITAKLVAQIRKITTSHIIYGTVWSVYNAHHIIIMPLGDCCVNSSLENLHRKNIHIKNKTFI